MKLILIGEVNQMQQNTNNKIITFKILSILFMVIGLVVLIIGMIEYFKVVSSTNIPMGIFDRPLLITYASFPLLLGGFFFYILGWGKKK